MILLNGIEISSTLSIVMNSSGETVQVSHVNNSWPGTDNNYRFEWVFAAEK